MGQKRKFQKDFLHICQKFLAIFEDFSKWNVQKPTSNSRILIYENNDI